jgi:hypothetical protein
VHLTVIDSPLPVIADAVSTKPLIREESVNFAGRFGDQEYALGSKEDGVARASRRMSELRRKIPAEVP